ncbi:hypothetical protein [Natronococcus roseus]|uniref:hypothetical protein n=1 Tax=Natronococcus roseus TaxID=1052014 RepID=UPI00374D98BF
MDDLEEEYQLQRVLNEGDVRARVDSVHISSDNSVYITLIVGAEHEITLCLGASNPRGGGPRELATLKPLCNELDFSFSRDISPLVGNEVTIESYMEKPEKIKISEGGVGYQPIVDEAPVTDKSLQKLSKDTHSFVQRHHRHEANEDEFIEATIMDVAVHDDDLLLSLEVYGELLQWSVDIPEGVIDSDSEYAILVEKVGGGSVKQVEDSSVYVTPQHELGSAPDDYQSVLGTATDLFKTWVIFPSKEDIEQPRLTPVARQKHTKNMNYDDPQPNNPDAWEKRPIPYSTAHRVETAVIFLFGLGLILGLFIGEAGGFIMLASMIGWITVKIFKFHYYHTGE